MAVALRLLSGIFNWPLARRIKLRPWFVSVLHDLQCRRVLFIVADGDSLELHRAVEYVCRNEQIRFMKIVWFYQQDTEIPTDLDRIHSELDRGIALVHIDFVLVQSVVSTNSIRSLARRLEVPP